MALAAQEQILTSKLDNPYLINEHLQVFHTPKSLTGQEAIELINSGQMDQSDERINPGMDHPLDHYWVQFEIENDFNTPADLFLEIAYPQLDFIEVFEIKDDSTSLLFTTGDRFVFEQRPVISNTYVFPLQLNTSTSGKLLIHLEKFKSAMRFPMYLYNDKAYTRAHFKTNLVNSIYFGIILLVAITSLVLSFIVRNATFAIYSLYLLSFGLWLFTRLGYSYQFLIPNLPEVNRHFLPVAGQLAVMALIVYVRSFFNTRVTLPMFHKVMTGVLVFFSLGYVAWALFPDEFVEYATRLFVVRYTLFTTSIAFTFTASIAYRKVEKFRSHMFLLAYSLFLSAILSKIVAEYGVVNEYELRYDPIMVGFLVEVSVLSVAMGVILKRIIHQGKQVQQDNHSLKQTIEKIKVKAKAQQDGYILLNSKATINVSDIVYIKSDDHYLEYVLTSGKKEIDRNSLSQALDRLPAYFLQTHRSFIVNLDHVKAMYADKLVMNDGSEVRMSRKYKPHVHNRLNASQES